jgi:SAM-dependent methyltransferase
MNKLFIDKNIKVYQGVDAENLISEKNDSKYIENGAILKVDKDRWLDAQHYEKKTWMEVCINSSDDRNYEHYQRFDSYLSIVEYQKNNKIKSAIELGCGPFTNIRTFLDILPNIDELHLLDPLIDEYLSHPNCKFKNKKMGNHNITTYNCSIEEFQNNIKYDLVIMNNVLEHCYNIEYIFNNILNILNENGVFIFSDVYFNELDVEKMVYKIYDTGHPIKVSSSYMNKFLSNFNEIYSVDLHGLYGQEWRHDKYFIGTKK